MENKRVKEDLQEFDTIQVITMKNEVLILTVFSIEDDVIECVVIEKTQNYNPKDEYIIQYNDLITILP